jgi:hypothetical protein
VRAPPTFRWTAPLLLAALLASACSGTRHPRAVGATTSTGEAEGPVAAIVPVKQGTGIVAERGFTTGPIASTTGHLFWIAARGEEGGHVLLVGRNLATGRTKVLARNPAPALGLATTSESLIFATRAPTGTDLLATDLGGGHRRVLSDSLAAPFDARDDVVAWAEEAGARQRVVAANLRTGRRVVALDGDRCPRGRCYRIDRVTVAHDGVVFDRGSVGQGYPSLVGRRSWHANRTEYFAVPHDPQPDLARSAGGALFYQLGRGWIEWNFGDARPRVSAAAAQPWLLEAQDGLRLALSGRVCHAEVSLLDGTGRLTRLPAPLSTPASPAQFGPLCRQLIGVAWTGKRLLLGWSLEPKVSVEGHTDIGLSGIITAVRVP